MLQGRLNPAYVLDQMEMYEVDCLMSHLYLVDKSGWEQTRLLGYISAQTHSTKTMKPSDIVTFPWEEGKEGAETSMSNAEKQRLIEKAKRFEQMSNGH